MTSEPGNNATCPACEGSGIGTSDYCGFCGGSGGVPIPDAEAFLSRARKDRDDVRARVAARTQEHTPC